MSPLARGSFGNYTVDQRRLRAPLSRSPLLIFDQDDGSRRVGRYLDCFTPPAVFSKSEAALLGVFLGEGCPNLLTAIDCQGVDRAITTSRLLSADSTYSQQIIIRTVFGATEQMPFRALAYPLPAIRLAQELSAQGAGIPRIELVFMSQAGIQANHLDLPRVRQERGRLIKLITAYIGEFHPSLLGRVSFLNDDILTPLLLNSPNLAHLADILSKSPQAGQLYSLGENHGGNEQAFIYGTLHSYLHDLVPTTDLSTDLLISIGAQPEKIFYHARQVLKPYLSEIIGFRQLPTIQYLAPFNVPPYQPLSGHDPRLSDIYVQHQPLDLDDVHTPVRQAVNLLAQDTGGLALLFEFINSHSRR